MKHIELFESFDPMGMDMNMELNSPYSAIGVFIETEMAVGVFPTEEAKKIYSRIKRSIYSVQQEYDGTSYHVEIVDLPEGHDLVVVPLGGRGISTTNEIELKNYTGQPIHDVVELGRDYDYGVGEDDMIFKADRNLKGFVVLDSAGGTRFMKSSGGYDFFD